MAKWMEVLDQAKQQVQNVHVKMDKCCEIHQCLPISSPYPTVKRYHSNNPQKVSSGKTYLLKHGDITTVNL